MIHYEMLKYVMIGGFKVGFWFVMHNVIAWPFAAYYSIKEVLRKKQFDRKADLNRLLQMFLIAFIGSLIGSRVLAFLGPWSSSCASGGLWQRFAMMMSFEEKGWVALGGIVGGILACYLYSKITKIRFLKYADILTAATALGFFIARLGCYIAGCCFGSGTNVPWAIIKDGVPIHPTQLYNSLADLAMFIILLYLSAKKEKENKYDGYIFFWFLLVYAVGRFITEFFRGDYGPSDYYFGLTNSQLMCIVFLLISVPVLIFNSMNESRRKKAKIDFHIRPKTYALLVSGGVMANLGAYIFTPFPYLALALVPSGLAIFFIGLTTIFSKPKN